MVAAGVGSSDPPREWCRQVVIPERRGRWIPLRATSIEPSKPEGMATIHPGYKYGLPAWHAVTGAGLPVSTPKFWVPPKGEVSAKGTSRDDYVMGKLPVISTRFHVDRERGRSGQVGFVLEADPAASTQWPFTPSLPCAQGRVCLTHPG